MEALRIILTQSKAHYRKEETIDNKMTYPLPPFSTVIGAIHRACGFREYHPMNLCIQGKYSSLIKQPYTDHCFLDSVMDDRGILVKMKNTNLLNAGFYRVAEAKKSTGNSFKKQITIDILNQKLFDEFLHLKNADKETIKKFSESDKENLNRYKSLTTSLKFCEILHDVKLIIHITSEEEGLLEIIEKNIHNLKAIGRSEDFVNIEDCRIIKLREIGEGEEVGSSIPGYINYEFIKNNSVFLDKNDKKGIPINGTKYYLGKVYNRDKGFRDFGDKVKVVYTSNYDVDEDSENIFIDEIKDEKIIVQFS